LQNCHISLPPCENGNSTIEIKRSLPLFLLGDDLTVQLLSKFPFYHFQVSDGLDNLLEDLSSLNRMIVNADPILASPDKLRDDLEENKVRSYFQCSFHF
jgi:hypothetical protein